MAITATGILPAKRRPGRWLLVTGVVLGITTASVVAASNGDLAESLGLGLPETTLAPETTDRSAGLTGSAPLLSGEPVPVATTDPANLVAVVDEDAASEISTEQAPSSTTPDDNLTSAPDLPRLPIDPAFDQIHDRLVTAVDVPIRLPEALGDSALEWTPTVSSIDASGYVVHLGIGESCNGASTCRISTFTAQRSNRTSPRLPIAGTPVPLPNGLSGVFLDSTCGSDCTNGFITWAEDDVLYSVGSRLASGPDVLALAWSAIDASVDAPEPPEICGPGAPADTGRVSRPISTELSDGRPMHWLLVCSGDGTAVEILETPGELRWVDLDNDGFRDIVLTADDGTTTIFAVGANQPRAAIDISTSGRLVIGELRCADLDGDGQREPVDLSSNERLDFVNPVTVRRSPADLESSDLNEC